MYTNGMKLRSVVVLGVSILLAIIGFGWYLHVRPDPERTASQTTPTVSVSPAATPTPPTTAIPQSGPIWRTTDESRAFNGTVPPVPRLVDLTTNIQSAQGFERLSFAFDTAAAPGYRIRRATALGQDGSGIPVTIPGSTSYLEIGFDPAQAHTDSGTLSFSRGRNATISGTVLSGYSVTGDFEGRVTVGVGLRVPSSFRSSVERVGDTWVVTVDVRAN